MPRRETKRGAQRTPLDADCDVLICGASFAGLAVARELSGTGARVLMVDRYEIGERQTSACAAPTPWLVNMGLGETVQQTFSELVVHTPRHTARCPLPFTFSTFDYRALCAALRAQSPDVEFDTAKVQGRTGHTVHTDRGDLRAPLIVDALGWRRVLGAGGSVQPPDALLSRGLEVHPHGPGSDMELWINRRYVPAGYGWSFPAGGERRIGVGSFDPCFHVRSTTELLADDLGAEKVRWQGNWIPHFLRPATEDGVFFVGDSAGHCLPLTAEGIRTAWYFAIACARELRGVLHDRTDRAEALRRYHDFSAEHAWEWRWMFRVQRLIPRLPPRALDWILRGIDHKPVLDWSFEHYLEIAPPSFALGASAALPRPRPAPRLAPA